MLKDIPYSMLKKDRRAFEILKLRDQYNRSFADLAKEYGISTVRARQIYDKIKINQIHLYINRISIALGYESTTRVRKEFHAAYECYWALPYVCAYLEEKYRDILDAYRCGEPGMPEQLVKNMPPLKPELSEEIIAHIVEAREKKKETFIMIAKEIGITPEKARHTYAMFDRRRQGLQLAGKPIGR